MPPPLSGQVVSEIQAPELVRVVTLVPPTEIANGSSDGALMAIGHAPKSPDAWNMDWPCAAICIKICSRVASTRGLMDQEELSCLAWLSVAIRFRMSFATVPSYTIT